MKSKSNLKLFTYCNSQSKEEKILLINNSAITPLALFSRDIESSGEMAKASQLVEIAIIGFQSPTTKSPISLKLICPYSNDKISTIKITQKTSRLMLDTIFGSLRFNIIMYSAYELAKSLLIPPLGTLTPVPEI